MWSQGLESGVFYSPRFYHSTMFLFMTFTRTLLGCCFFFLSKSISFSRFHLDFLKNHIAIKPSYSTDDAFVNIDVKYEPDESFTCYNVDLLKPRIISRLPKKLELKRGQKVELTCLTTVLFPTEVSWYLNDQLLNTTSDRRISFENRYQHIKIVPVNENDAGVISCVASNMFGKDVCECTIEVDHVDINGNVMTSW